MKKPIYNWDSENKIATCTIRDEEGHIFQGKAVCHPEDMEFASEYVGYDIATERAIIDYLKYVKRDVLMPGLKALNQLYYSINKSKEFSYKHYETRMLMRQIRMKESDIELITESIAIRSDNLARYIESKGETYKKIREMRKSKQCQQD